jgi:hypothetical protein
MSAYGYLFDHWNSISRFLLGPLLLSGSKVYSPATEPSITTRSIWIVTLPNDFCSHKETLRILSVTQKQRNREYKMINVMHIAYSIPFRICCCFCRRYEASGLWEGCQMPMQKLHPIQVLHQLTQSAY